MGKLTTLIKDAAQSTEDKLLQEIMAMKEEASKRPQFDQAAMMQCMSDFAKQKQNEIKPGQVIRKMNLDVLNEQKQNNEVDKPIEDVAQDLEQLANDGKEDEEAQEDDNKNEKPVGVKCKFCDSDDFFQENDGLVLKGCHPAFACMVCVVGKFKVAENGFECGQCRQVDAFPVGMLNNAYHWVAN